MPHSKHKVSCTCTCMHDTCVLACVILACVILYSETNASVNDWSAHSYSNISNESVRISLPPVVTYEVDNTTVLGEDNRSLP